MNGRKLRIGIAVLAIFFIGFYHEPIANYFNTINTIIGLLFGIIIGLCFWLQGIYRKKNSYNNSFHYSDSENNKFRRDIEEKNEIIKEQQSKINSLEFKIDEWHRKYQMQLSEINQVIYNLKTKENGND